MRTNTEISQPIQNADAVAQPVIASIWLVLFVVLAGMAIGVFNRVFLERLYWKILWFFKNKIDEQVSFNIEIDRQQLEHIYHLETAKK